MNKGFIPYEDAVALHELGYMNDEADDWYFHSWGNVARSHHNRMKIGQHWNLYKDVDESGCFNAPIVHLPKSDEYGEHFIAAPLWQQAFEFFRTKYELHAELVWDFPPIDGDILNGTEEDVHWCCVVTPIGYLGDDMEDVTEWIKDYNEARLEGLRIMIKMIKDYESRTN